MLLCCMIVSAGFTDNTVQVYDLNASRALINPVSGIIAINTDNYWQLFTPDGKKPLSERYNYIDLQDQLFAVDKSNGGQNCKGLLDENGKEIMPPRYAWVITLSDRWNAGIVSKPGTADAYDFYGKNNALLLIDKVDIYYRGSLCGSLDRMDWDLATPCGDYLKVKSRDGRYNWYSKDWKKSPLEECGYDEYWIDYNSNDVIHQGSGQKAFVSGCTLHEDEVECSLYYRDGEIVDLQGNVVCYPEDCEPSLRFAKGNLIHVKNRSYKHGLIDRTGKQVVSCLYDSIDYSTEAAESCGYVYAERDGKSGFVNVRTGEETGFEFASSKCEQYYGFFTVTDLDGTLIVTCAGAGKLPDHYTEIVAFSIYQSPVRPSNPPAILKTTEGQYGVIDLNGNWILDPNDKNVSAMKLCSANYDGTVFLVETERYREGRSIVLSTKWQEYGDGQDSPESGTPAPTETPAGEQTETADTWICENGHEGNSGKFCSECGAPKPTPTPAPMESAGTWTCENGHEGNMGKFCIECGAPMPVDNGPWTCTNGHEGNTGKYCIECGEPRAK